MTCEWTEHPIKLGEVGYPFYVGSACIDRILDALAEYGADKFIVVTDDTVLAQHGEMLLTAISRLANPILCSAPAGDAMKSHSTLFAHIEKAIEAGATRRSVVVAFGGGVPGNLGGLVAALLFRGIRLIHIPTTLVAAMDSVVSLKQAINSPFGKNHVGTFHVPSAVYVDLEYLRTLPAREIQSGLCEVAKNCLGIRPASLPFFHDLLVRGDPSTSSALQWLLEESLLAKTAVMARDSMEQRTALILEYGHTVGHAIEFCDQHLHGREAISHGESVALGMLVAANVAAALGVMDAPSLRSHEEISAALGVRSRLPQGIEVEDIMRVVRTDNKRGYIALAPDEAAMVLLRALGEPLGERDLPLVPVPMATIEAALTQVVDRPEPAAAAPSDSNIVADAFGVD